MARILAEQVSTPTGQIAAELVLRDGVIAAVEARASCPAGAIDWTGDVLVAGLIDIHTANLEKHYQPRPRALWDAYGAALLPDGQCVTARTTPLPSPPPPPPRHQGCRPPHPLCPSLPPP